MSAVVLVGGDPLCPHPEDERGPAPYNGKAPRAEDWECGLCGAYQWVPPEWTAEPDPPSVSLGSGEIYVDGVDFGRATDVTVFTDEALADWPDIKAHIDAMARSSDALKTIDETSFVIPRVGSVEFTASFDVASSDVTNWGDVFVRPLSTGRKTRISARHVDEANVVEVARKLIVEANNLRLRDPRRWEASRDVFRSILRQAALPLPFTLTSGSPGSPQMFGYPLIIETDLTGDGVLSLVTTA